MNILRAQIWAIDLIRSFLSAAIWAFSPLFCFSFSVPFYFSSRARAKPALRSPEKTTRTISGRASVQIFLPISNRR